MNECECLPNDNEITLKSTLNEQFIR
jgi:hypothetical protein